MTEDIGAQVDDLISDFRAYGQKVYSKVGKAVLKGSMTVEREAKQLFRPSDAENAFTGGYNFWEEDPSSFNQPPRVQTGRLRASITHRLAYEDQKIVGEVGTNVEYGVYLEFGTSKMSPYPFMAPALAKHEAEIYAEIDKAEEEAERESF